MLALPHATPVEKGPRQLLWGIFQPCLGGVLEGFLVEGMWWLCLWAVEWVVAQALKVLEGRMDCEPSQEPMRWRAGHACPGILGCC